MLCDINLKHNYSALSGIRVRCIGNQRNSFKCTTVNLFKKNCCIKRHKIMGNFKLELLEDSLEKCSLILAHYNKDTFLRCA